MGDQRRVNGSSSPASGRRVASMVHDARGVQAPEAGREGDALDVRGMGDDVEAHGVDRACPIFGVSATALPDDRRTLR